MNAPLRINARGIALRDELLLLNLTRACAEAGRGERNWQWADSDDVDVLFVPADAPPAAAGMPVLVPLLPPATLERGQGHLLRLPIRPAAFVALMERVQRRKLLGPAPASAGEPPAAAADDMPAIDRLIQRLRRQPGGAFEIRAGAATLVIAPALRQGWMADAAAPIALPARFVLHEAPAAAAPPHALALDHFLWQAAMAQPEPEAARTWFQHGRLGLKRWPDFGRFGRDPTAVRLTSVLARAHPDFQTLARVADGQAQRATAFLNALALLDLLAVDVDEAASAPPAPARAAPAAAPAAKAGVFSRIRAALGLG